MTRPEDSTRVVSASVIIIGNEILSGRTIDANLPYIAKHLGMIGIVLYEARVIRDDPDEIIRTVNEMRHKYDYVFTTGGIGPTHDDITTACVARSFGLDLVIDPEARRRLQTHYDKRGVELNQARLRMAHVPVGATLIDNPISAAPGFRIGNVFVMAGVPNICHAMFDSIKPVLAGGPPILSVTITGDVMEGNIAAALTAIQHDNNSVEIGSYPFWTAQRVGVSIVLRSPSQKLLETATEQVMTMIRNYGGAPERVETT